MADIARAAIVIEAVASIEDVGSRIEDVFAKVGGHLGGAHAIFENLTCGLSSVSEELSGSKSDDASTALQDIAARLSSLAGSLPAETALLNTMRTCAAQASAMLKQVIGHIQMITVITRSSRIEAASLDSNRGDFLSFTKGASDLANSVQRLIAGCSKDQEKLSSALEMAFGRHLAFERRYGDQLVSVSADLISVYAEIGDRQARSVQLTESVKQNTRQIGAAVGASIVSLQAGDSARQRLEHSCHGLRKIAGTAVGLVPSAADNIDRLAPAAPFVCLLQAAQLRDTVSSFEADIDVIGRTLMALSNDAAGVVGQGRDLFSGRDNDVGESLARMRQKLAQANELIAACGAERKVVDASIADLEAMLVKFRGAMSDLGDAVIDIILIGMNAGLKAGHLGAQGRSFVVIANELKVTADRIASGARALEPVLNTLAQSADGLKMLRKEEGSLPLAELQRSIIGAIRDIEAGNGLLGGWMENLTRESLQFEALMVSANTMMSALKDKSAMLPGVARELEKISGGVRIPDSSEVGVTGELFDDLYVTYTMGIERTIHDELSRRLGFAGRSTGAASASDDVHSDDMVFF